MLRVVKTRDKALLEYTITHSPRPKYDEGTWIAPLPSLPTERLWTTVTWKFWEPLHTECRCTGYAPAGSPLKDTGREAGTAGAGCGLAGGGGGGGEGEEMGVGAGSAEGEATAVGDGAAVGVGSAEGEATTVGDGAALRPGGAPQAWTTSSSAPNINPLRTAWAFI